MSETRWFNVLVVDANQFSETAESDFYVWTEAETAINGLNIKATVTSSPQQAKFLFVDDKQVDAILYAGINQPELNDFIERMNEVQAKQNRKVPLIDMLQNKNTTLAPFIKEFYKNKVEYSQAELNEAESVVAENGVSSLVLTEQETNVELFNDVIIRINDVIAEINVCEDQSIKAAANQLTNKIIHDFNESCSGIEDLITVKTMLEKVVEVLDAHHGLAVIKKNKDTVYDDVTTILRCDEAIKEQEKVVTSKLSELKEFSAGSYEKFFWKENLKSLVMTFVRAVALAVGGTSSSLGLKIVGIFGLKSNLAERPNAVNALMQATSPKSQSFS